jgi:hypothetical protein
MKTIRENFTPKNFCSLLVVGSLLISLWTLAGFAVKYFVYLKQSNYSIAQVFDWGVIELDSDKYVVCADFSFYTNGIDKYVSQHIFEDKEFSSKKEAELAMEAMKQKQIKCYWYGNALHPKISMQRVFPLKSLVYVWISFGVFLYFSALKKRILNDIN